MEYTKLMELFPGIYTEVEPTMKNVCYEASQCSDFFKKFDCLNESQDTVVLSLLKNPTSERSSKRIPSLLHFIWLGSSPLPEESHLNISYFAKTIQDLGGSAVFWTDQANVKPELHDWLKKNSIHLMKVDMVFGRNEDMVLFCHFRGALAKIPSNFGEASDLLRYEIIHQFGGYYFDHDVKKGDVDLSALLSKGKNNQYGFVCGRADDQTTQHPRNDVFGSVQGNVLIKKLKILILENYNKKTWKSHATYKRPFLTDFTVWTTGPDVFGLAIEDFFRQGRDLTDKHKMDIVKTIYVPSKVGQSAETWVHGRRDAKPIQSLTEHNWPNRVRHDLMLSLIYEEKILDLEKYQLYSQEHNRNWLIPVMQELFAEYPSLFESVDRIFIGDVNLYIQAMEILQNSSEKVISWNEMAVLKFACITEANDLVSYLLEDKQLDPFEATFADVGYYDCSHAQPMSILIETGNLTMIRKVLSSPRTKQVGQNLAFKHLGLIYAGRSYGLLEKNSQIPGFKIEQSCKKKKRLSDPFELEKIDQQIHLFQAIQQLLDRYKLT